MEKLTRVQYWDKAICISRSTYILGKIMDPTILPRAKGISLGRLSSSSVVLETDVKEEHSEYKPVRLD